jgi:hypothetical protein
MFGTEPFSSVAFSSLRSTILSGSSDITILVVQSALGELKFVPIDTGQSTETWSAITHTGDNWTDLNATGGDVWSGITHSGGTWTDVDLSSNSDSWTEVVN